MSSPGARSNKALVDLAAAGLRLERANVERKLAMKNVILRVKVAYFSGASVTQIAKLARVSRQTVYDLLKK